MENGKTVADATPNNEPATEAAPNTKKTKEPIKDKICTHQKTDLDEIFILYMLIRYGVQINCVPQSFYYIRTNEVTEPDPNTLYVGVNAGDYDEHSDEGDTKEESSAAALIARDLKMPEVYHDMLKYVDHDDSNNTPCIGGMGNIIKHWFAIEDVKNSPEEAMKYAERINKWAFEVFENRVHLYGEYSKNEYDDLMTDMRTPRATKEEIYKAVSLFDPSTMPLQPQRIVLSQEFTIPHAVAVRLLQAQEAKGFCGTTYQTKVVVVDPENFVPKANDIVIGFGTGSLAELPAMKLAHYMNHSQRGYFGKLISYCIDLHHRKEWHSMELAGMLRDRWLSYGTESQVCKSHLKWTLAALKILVEIQKRYVWAISEFRKKMELKDGSAFQFTRSAKDGKEKVAVAHSDNPRMGAYLLGKNDIVVIRNSRDQVTILTKLHSRTGWRFRMDRITGSLRDAEIKALTGQSYSGDRKLLSAKGRSRICPTWFYFKPMEMVINGGPKYPDAAPTVLKTQEIVNIISAGVDMYLGKSNNNKGKRKRA